MDWDISASSFNAHTTDLDYPPGSNVSLRLRQGMLDLAKRCSEVLLSLYSQRHNAKPDGLLRFIARIHKDLYKWHEQLPPEISWPRDDGKEPPSPGILIMQ